MDPYSLCALLLWYNKGMTVISRERGKVNTHTNSRYLRELRQVISLSEIQKSVLSGALMGDGCIIPTASGKNYRLQIEHANKQREYVFWKYEVFKDFVVTPPKRIRSAESWRFRTISHKEFVQLRQIFYRNWKKILPRRLDFILNPIALAVWFMDDGCLDKKRGYILNTQNFTFEENMRLMSFLSEKLHIALSVHRDRIYYRLYVKRKSMSIFRNLLDAYMHPIMRYKLS